MFVKPAKHIFGLFVGMFLFITIVFSGCGAEKTEPAEPYVQILNSQETYVYEDKIILQVFLPEFEFSDAENYAYNLWVKTEKMDWVREIENEPISNFYVSENTVCLQLPEYEFKQPGYIDLQLDIFNQKTNVTTQIYVDQFRIFTPRVSAPTAGTYYPRRLSFNVGEEIKIYGNIPLLEDENLSSFEYSLFVKKNHENIDWEQIIPYTNFKEIEEVETLMDGGVNRLRHACTYVFEDAGTYSIQLNIRNLDEGIDGQFWLGEFTAISQEPLAYKGIIRQILPAYDNIYDYETLYEVVSHDTILASRYMYHKYTNNLEDFQDWLNKNYNANEMRVENDSVFFTKKTSTSLQELNMQTGTLIYPAGTVELDLKNRPAEKTILQKLRNEDPELAVMALVNHFIYSHYDYAIPFPSPEVHDLRFPTAQCGYYAKDMYVFAKNAGFEAKWLSTADENNSSVHAVCQVLISDKWYTFDPTVNVIYREEVEKIDGNTPYIELFQSRNLDYLISAPYWDNVRKYNIFAQTSIEN